MEDADTTWVDVRWLERGWREAFRLRLTGWIPASWVPLGIEEGVLENYKEALNGTVKLTERGMKLTEPCPGLTTDATLRFMSFVLKTMDLDDACFSKAPKSGCVHLAGVEVFEESFSNKLIAHLKNG